MHAHGGGSRFLMNVRKEAFRAAIKLIKKHGATSIFPTLSSSLF